MCDFVLQLNDILTATLNKKQPVGCGFVRSHTFAAFILDHVIPSQNFRKFYGLYNYLCTLRLPGLKVPEVSSIFIFLTYV